MNFGRPGLTNELDFPLQSGPPPYGALTAGLPQGSPSDVIFPHALVHSQALMPISELTPPISLTFQPGPLNGLRTPTCNCPLDLLPGCSQALWGQ